MTIFPKKLKIKYYSSINNIGMSYEGKYIKYLDEVSCSSDDISLVKIGDNFDGWIGGLIGGLPDYLITITDIRNFRNPKWSDDDIRICYAECIDCTVKILNGKFIGETIILSSILPSGYKLKLFTIPGKDTEIHLGAKSIDEWNIYEKANRRKLTISDLITLKKQVVSNKIAKEKTNALSCTIC
ncbi:MAG: hypothetical protein EBZ58_12295 [Bacteroidetes bacterium]|nr:hypothetical protein [Bacteroidota bacterium]